MIVTFHLAVYFVYYVWNTYISGHSNESTCDSNEITNNNNRTNPTSGIENDQVHNSSKSGVLTDSSNPGTDNANSSSGNSDLKSEQQKNKQAKEGAGDFHPCLQQIFSDDEGEGRDIIYSCEPTFDCNYDAAENLIQFIPPVYIQRYMTIENILKQPCWVESVKKVVNFGCAELSFEMKHLKKMFGIQEVVSVDIDLETLKNNCCKISPTPTDYLSKRPTPLTMQVFCGSVAYTHESLVGADAVIAIELIEHLFPPELESLPFTIFGFIKPKIAIFTTPNADFNVLFPRLSGFRHPDHKFEWTQQQFEDWGNNLVLQYPDYHVAFQGIGPGPTNTTQYGCCSQMATFVKVCESPSISVDELHIQDGSYTLVRESVFPYFKDERTEEERIKDRAVCFITKCKLLSRMYDEEMNTEIPIQTVMNRINYFNKEKLKEILIADKWEITTNTSGEEVIIPPDSEKEESLGSEAEFDGDFNDLESFGEVTIEDWPKFEENWDCEEGADNDMNLTSESCPNQVYPVSDMSGCLIDERYLNFDPVNTITENDSANIEKVCNTDDLNVSYSEQCSITEAAVPDVELCDKINSSLVVSVPEKDTNLNLEKSIYETPYSNGFSSNLKHDCDSCDCSSNPSLSEQDHTFKICKRALVMESPNEFTDCDVNSQKEDPFCCLSTIPSSCDTSIYATPCCSHRHRKNIPKCLSLQQINSHCSLPVFSNELDQTLKDGELVRELKDKFSKSVEGFKSLESDLTCSSASRIVDSGYPDSYSEYTMDMDLTPEQFDDIETESEGNNVSSRSLSPPPPPQIPWLMDDVQNGDVANNNRDGEGNNLVADMDEEPLEFEARIDEVNNEVPNMAAADLELNLCCDLKSSKLLHEVCGDHCLPVISDPLSLSVMANEQACLMEKSATISDALKFKSVFTEKNREMVLSDALENQSIRSTKSDTSIMTNYSWILDSTESQTHCNSEGAIKPHKKQGLTKLRTHNSLTTVLDGHSKFSNCSLVRPVEVFQVTGQENSENVFSVSMHSDPVPGGSTDNAHSESTHDAHKCTSLTAIQIQEDPLDVISVYQSAESLNNCESVAENNIESSSFPEWLLNILLSDSEENEVDSGDSVQSVWDSDSLEELVGLNFDVQVDVRGGGDPQRDTWQ